MAKALTKIASLARAHTESAIRRLVGIMESDASKDNDVIAAANALLNRGWGMPKQDFGDEDGNKPDFIVRIVKLSDADYADRDTGEEEISSES